MLQIYSIRKSLVQKKKDAQKKTRQRERIEAGPIGVDEEMEDMDVGLLDESNTILFSPDVLLVFQLLRRI